MDTAAKVFAYISFVIGIVYGIVITIVSIILASTLDPIYLLLFFSWLPTIVVLICARKMIKSVNEGYKETYVGVLGLLFVSIFAGIFYLCWEPHHYHGYSLYSKPKTTPKPVEVKPATPVIQYVEPAEALLSLKKLRDLGILTEKQYKEKSDKYKKYL